MRGPNKPSASPIGVCVSAVSRASTCFSNPSVCVLFLAIPFPVGCWQTSVLNHTCARRDLASLHTVARASRSHSITPWSSLNTSSLFLRQRDTSTTTTTDDSRPLKRAIYRAKPTTRIIVITTNNGVLGFVVVRLPVYDLLEQRFKHEHCRRRQSEYCFIEGN